MLSLVATPIGNLSDFTFRAISTLSNCDYILCEDTRYSTRLLAHYKIQKPLKSLHKFNEASQLDKIISDLHDGKNIAVISDAGTPGISDPGELLVKAVIQAGLIVESIPGPCAAITAITASGLATSRFQFYGYLPRKEGELKRAFLDILQYEGTTICYESPNRIIYAIEQLSKLDGTREIVIARELTKIHEQFLRGPALELLALIADTEIRGEIVLLIAPRPVEIVVDWTELSPEAHVEMIERDYKLSHLDAIKMVAKLRGVPKREIYQKLNNHKN